jgi:hypothetical protein
MSKVEVGRTRKVGVGGACVTGDAHATSTVKPSRKDRSTLVFIFISSFYYILRPKEKRQAIASWRFVAA